MTDRKDFKRVVRARARRTGESYSSALRNVRNARTDRSAATASKGRDPREPLVNITRAIPDVRSTSIDKTVRFYTELIGFDTCSENGRVISFVSASHDGVEVTLNRDEFALPPGFTVEVETEGDVGELFDRARRPMRASSSRLETLSSRCLIPRAAESRSPPPTEADRPRQSATQPDQSRGRYRGQSSRRQRRSASTPTTSASGYGDSGRRPT